MAYKALYRTYRPNSFDEVAGQEHVVRTLQHAVQQNKIAHAYLFCGPRGTGKTSIAKIFAKMINCESDEHQPCGTCENCMAVSTGTHPDIIEIDAASNNGVEEVRNLIEKVKYAPLKGKYKVYIIDEVHMMSTGAFNALLKTIEEPPEHIIFILATTEPQKVLPTIISRCQRFDFTKVSDAEIVARLTTVLNAEGIECDNEVIRIIAQLADGGLRDALSIMDQCIAYAQNHIQVHHINEIYGITTVTEKLEILNMIFQKDALHLLEVIDRMIEKGIDIKRLTNDLIEILKESIIYEYTKEVKLIHILNIEEVSLIISQVTIKQRFGMINLLMEAYDKYRFAANANSYFEVCLLKMLDVPTEEVVAVPVQRTISTQQISQKTSVPVQKKVLEAKPVLMEQNVSRETLQHKPVIENSVDEGMFTTEEQEGFDLGLDSNMTEAIGYEIKPVISLDDEYILGLLAGANKPEKSKDMEHFQSIEQYTINLTWGKYANAIKHGCIVGSGNNYIVLAVDNQAEANQINEMDKNNEFAEFLKELLDKPKKLFAISKDQQQRVIVSFKDRMINGTLPEPVFVEQVEIHTSVVKEKTQDEVILDLFGEENITIMEE